MKKLFLMLTTFLLVTFVFTIQGYARYSDVPEGASYGNALEKLTALGVFNGSGNKFNPGGPLTREQFAKIFTIAANYIDYAVSHNGATVYPDVPLSGWSNGYINAAVNKGYITGMPDRRFHPSQALTYAQACTILVRMLGYGDGDVKGLWPQNYIDQAQDLGLTEGLSFQSGSRLPRWAAVVMLDRVLEQNVKRTAPSEADKTFSEQTGFYSQYIILGNKSNMSSLGGNRIMTDKGILDCDLSQQPDIGGKYLLNVKDGHIKKSFYKLKNSESFTVYDSDGKTLSYIKDERIESKYLPDSAQYYHQGKKVAYDVLKDIIKENSSVILGKTDDDTAYEYGVIVNSGDGEQGSYQEGIILGNPDTDDGLSHGQVLTDKGIFLLANGINVELGNKYGLVISSGKIVKVTGSLKKTLEASAVSISGTTLNYMIDGKQASRSLSEKTVYYYKGTKYALADLGKAVQRNSSFVFGYGNDQDQCEYAAVFDPLYSKPEIASGAAVNNKVGSLDLSGSLVVIKNNKVVTPAQIEQNDAVYSVTDILGKNKYILVMDDKVYGKITGIVPNRVSPNTLQIESKNYDLDKNMNITKLGVLPGSFGIDDKVTAILGYNGKIIDVQKFVKKTGPFTECLIMGDSSTVDTLSDNQIITDKGTFYYYESDKLEIGSKYKLVIDGSNISRLGEKISSKTLGITVINILDNRIYYSENDDEKSMTLPNSPVYYYKGASQKYDDLKNVIQPYSSIIFTYNDSSQGFQYAVVCDPVYSGPDIVNDSDLNDEEDEDDDIKLVDFKIASDDTVVRQVSLNMEVSDNKVTKSYDIEEGDVLYKVSDIWNKHYYFLDLNNKITGHVIDVQPNRISPKSVTIKINDNTVRTFEFSRDGDFSAFGINGKYDITDNPYVELLLGRDGKIVDTAQ